MLDKELIERVEYPFVEVTECGKRFIYAIGVEKRARITIGDVSFTLCSWANDDIFLYKAPAGDIISPKELP